MLRRAIDLSRVPPITGPEDKVTLMCGDLYEVIQLPWLGLRNGMYYSPGLRI